MVLRSLAITSILVSLSACNMSGSGQKGPYTSGSSVSVSELDQQALPITSTTKSSLVTGSQGQYSVDEIEWSGWTEIEIVGTYFNEFTGENSEEVLSLNAVTRKDRTADSANVHLFSHLAAARIRQQVTDGKNVNNAWRSTQQELKDIFGLERVSQNYHRGVEQLSLLNGRGSYRRDNANLLLFTGSFLAIGGDQSALQLLADDFADDAQFNGVGESTFNSIAVKASSADLLNTLSDNLKSYGVRNPPNSGDMSSLPDWVIISTDDVTPPVITLLGDDPTEIEVGSNYQDAGATASDDQDGDISSNIATTGEVDTNTSGTYTLTYNVSDAAGNLATEVTRTVNVIETIDSTIPVISLNGDATVNVEQGTSYTEAGATATDEEDGIITSNIVIGGDTVNPAVAGTYLVTYNVSDGAGNAAAQVTRTVVVADTTAPLITIGNANVSLVEGGTFTDDVSATDSVDGNVTANIVTTGSVNTNAAGTYVLTYNVSDAASNNAVEVTRTVTVTEAADENAPVISLNGSATVNVEQGTSYTEQGATATDEEDGIITANIVIGGDTVNPAVAATYLVTYNVSDGAGNHATQVTRTVIVADTIAPVITIGNANVSLVEGETFTEDVSATDSVDGTITANIVTTGEVDTNTAGTYVLTYNVSDAASNNAVEVTRTVTVTEAADENAPVISLNGSATVNVEQGTSYTEQGATARDEEDGIITANIVIGGDTVNPNVAGTYSVTYNVSDGAGNLATQLTRTVIVADTAGPEITLIGDNPLDVEINSDYTEAGATAQDTVDGDVQVTIDSSAVDITTLGTYEVSYSAVDAIGNTSSATKAVNVVDTTPPMMEYDTSPVQIEAGSVYTDAGAFAIDNENPETIFNAEADISAVNTNVPGSYIVTYTASDNTGNTTTGTKTVNVIDTTAPVITINGNNPVDVEVGSIYVDDGAIATDIVDGSFAATADTSGVDTMTVGSYTVTYTATDAASNQALAVTRTVNVIPAPSLTYQCYPNVSDESQFVDQFIIDSTDDQAWPFDLAFTQPSVEEIADIFNTARLADIDGVNARALTMPSQEVWDGYSDSQKALFLINDERCARSLKPFEGIAPSAVELTSQPYADLLVELNIGLSHEADGRTPYERLAQDSGVVVGSTADFFTYGENLASSSVISSQNYLTVYEPVAKAVYGWLYDDKADTAGGYGHRKFILATSLNDNSGVSNQEGLISVGVGFSQTLIQDDSTLYNSTVYTVLNGFDPNENWDMSDVEKVDLIKPSCIDGYVEENPSLDLNSPVICTQN